MRQFNIFMTTDKTGVRVESIGDSSGRLDQLLYVGYVCLVSIGNRSEENAAIFVDMFSSGDSVEC